MAALSLAHLKALRRAVSEAESWRGSIVGNPDPSVLEEFDHFISTARQAVKAAAKDRAELIKRGF